MPDFHLLLTLAPLLGLLLLAAAIDVRTRRIPNWLTAATAAGGIALALAGCGAVGPGFSLLGVMVGLLLLAVPFGLRLMGGGDVKLLAAVGAWLGPWGILVAFLAATVAAMAFAITQCAASGRLKLLLANVALVAVAARHLPQLGEEHLRETTGTMRSAGRPLPYAVSILVGTLVAVALL